MANENDYLSLLGEDWKEGIEKAEKRLTVMIASAPAFYASQSAASKKGQKQFVTIGRERGGIVKRIGRIVNNFLSKKTPL